MPRLLSNTPGTLVFSFSTRRRGARETARRAMQAKPLVFEDLDAAIRHIDRRAIHKDWVRDAGFLRQVRRQRTLDAW